MFIYRAQKGRRGHRGCTYHGAGYPKSQQILLLVFVLPTHLCTYVAPTLLVCHSNSERTSWWVCVYECVCVGVGACGNCFKAFKHEFS